MTDAMHDASLLAVLDVVGSSVDRRLGVGGEASVFAIDDERVVRVGHGSISAGELAERAALVAEIRTQSPTPLPEVVEVGEVAGRGYTVERRLPGRSADVELGRLERGERDELVVAVLDAVAGLADIDLTERGWFGDLLAADPVRSPVWREFLHDRIDRSLAVTAGFGSVDAASLVDDLPCGDDPECRAFLHLDAFAGNVMASGRRVTAIIDIGATSAIGDARLDQVAAVVYLCSTEITPVADARDRAVALRWLDERGLADWEQPVRRWLAAYWAWAVDDADLHRWCRRVLC